MLELELIALHCPAAGLGQLGFLEGFWLKAHEFSAFVKNQSWVVLSNCKHPFCFCFIKLLLKHLHEVSLPELRVFSKAIWVT